MKIKPSEIKTCRTAYLYHDGHMVLIHEKRDKDAGSVEWATIYENIGIDVNFEPGRLIINPAVLPFLLKAKRVTVSNPSEKNGSDNTRKRGIEVETIGLYNGNDRPWFISNFPGLISSDIYFNTNDTDTFKPDLYHWGDTTVKATYIEA